jgi:hypothetical protein
MPSRSALSTRTTAIRLFASELWGAPRSGCLAEWCSHLMEASASGVRADGAPEFVIETPRPIKC